MLFDPDIVESLALDEQLLLLSVVLDRPQLHLVIRLVVTLLRIVILLFVVIDAQLVDQTCLLVRKVVEGDFLSKFSQQVFLKVQKTILNLLNEVLRDDLERPDHSLAFKQANHTATRSKTFMLIEFKGLLKGSFVKLKLQINRHSLDVLILKTRDSHPERLIRQVVQRNGALIIDEVDRDFILKDAIW